MFQANTYSHRSNALHICLQRRRQLKILRIGEEKNGVLPLVQYLEVSKWMQKPHSAIAIVKNKKMTSNFKITNCTCILRVKKSFA